MKNPKLRTVVKGDYGGLMKLRIAEESEDAQRKTC
jgi:hypothetical protein